MATNYSLDGGASLTEFYEHSKGEGSSTEHSWSAGLNFRLVWGTFFDTFGRETLLDIDVNYVDKHMKKVLPIISHPLNTR